MQDRFKFRFWDKETQTMQKIPMVELRHKITLDKIFADDRVIFMQCTGLKDKNGKLIYEGDIARFKDNINPDGSNTHIGVIEHNETFNAFMYRVECMGLFTVNKIQNENFDVEIIGNIYENPELLEGKSCL